MYPPGIPLICPGEIVTEDIVEQCQELAAQSVVAFAEDSTLPTIAVLDR
jgi:arginine decarboxylase